MKRADSGRPYSGATGSVRGPRNGRSGGAPSKKAGDDFSSKSWNTSGYAMSVKTRRTTTRVISPERASRPRQDYYYDNTPAAVHSRHKKEMQERRDRYIDSLRRNKRIQKLKRALIYTATLLIFVSVLFTFVYKQFFVVGKITVNGNLEYSAEEITEASGLTSVKTNLYSFSSSATGSKVRFYLPYISDISFHRTLPNKVEITVEEEKALFYAEIYGECYSISSSLRVLETIDADEAAAGGLIKLKLQTVSKAVSGSEIEMASERAERYLKNTVKLVTASPLLEKLDAIDLTDDFDTVMIADGKYKLDFGTQEDFSVKVRLASEILENSLFESGNKAYINLKNTAETSVIIDNQLVLD